MRHDMRHVLTDRPRVGSRSGYHEVRAKESRHDHEDLPSHEGMRVPYFRNWGDHKEFSDHISPLIRYLWGCVGRPWNEVWSEICAQVPSGNTVDRHLRNHVLGEIDINCEAIDGTVYTKPSDRWTRYSRSEPRGLYVDPRDGLLKAGASDQHNSHRNAYKSHNDQVKIGGECYWRYDSGILKRRYSNDNLLFKFTDGGKAVLLDGIWYTFVIKTCKEPRIIVCDDDDNAAKPIWLRATKRITYPQVDELYHTTVHTGAYHANKRQMSSRDLKRYELRNIR
jgi:hypothetical protein